MRYTVLFCSKRGVKRVNPGQARSGLHARKPIPRRLSVFCSTTLDMRISNSTRKIWYVGGGPSFEFEDGGTSLLCWAEAIHRDVSGHGFSANNEVAPPFKISIRGRAQ